VPQLPLARTVLVRGYNTGISTALRLPGTAGNYASTPDVAALDITGDIDIRVLLAPAGTWAGGAFTPTILSKAIATDDQRAYRVRINSANARLIFDRWTDGTSGSLIASSSTTHVTFANGARGWIRITWEASSGDVTFYTSPPDDGVDWTQLGTTVSSSTDGPASTSAPLEFGSSFGGTANLFIGRIYQAHIFASLDGSAQRLAADFTNGPIGAASLVDGTGKVITIHSSGADIAVIVDEAV
jgi:hypothetical protein